MEVGIKQAKIDLSKLIIAAQNGQKVYLLNRGKRVAEITPVRTKTAKISKLPGYGMFRDELKLSPDWNTPEAQEREEREVLDMLSEW
jgi:antitoxin (DNA-binding transcriptional repressor) of toxin-antitoxin stability system